MSKTQEALKLALEALEWFTAAEQGEEPPINKAITAIREALAEQPAPVAEPHKQQQPVAYAVYHRMGGSKTLHWPEQHSDDGDHNEYRLVPLYEHPPSQQQKPVAVYVGETWCGSVVRLYEDLPLETPLYAHPPARKPWVGLTDEEMNAALDYWSEDERSAYGGAHAADGEYVSMIDTWRYIEAKLKEKNHG